MFAFGEKCHYVAIPYELRMNYTLLVIKLEYFFLHNFLGFFIFLAVGDI